jgi:hypothetical protein
MSKEEKQSAKSQNPETYNFKHFLDNISILVQSGGVCGAACFTGEKLLLSANNEFSMAETIGSFLKSVAQKVNKIIGPCKGMKLTEEDYKNIDTIMHRIQKEAEEELDKKYEEQYNKAKMDQRYKDPMWGSNKLYRLEAQKARRKIVKLMSEAALSTDNKNESSRILKQTYRAILDGQIEVIKKDPEYKEELDIHAEMQILQKLIEERGLLNRPSGDSYYIGISKSCCKKCEAMIAAVNTVTGQVDKIEVRGNHGSAFPSTGIPEFFSRSSETIQSLNTLYTLRKVFIENLISTGISCFKNLNPKDYNLKEIFHDLRGESSIKVGQLYPKSPERDYYISLLSSSSSGQGWKSLIKTLSGDSRAKMLLRETALYFSTPSSSSSGSDEKSIGRAEGPKKLLDFLSSRNFYISRHFSAGTEQQQQKLLELLSKIHGSSAVAQRQSNNWATGYGINQALNKYIGNYVHIIHPDASSVESPADPKKALEGAVAYAKMISGYYVDNKLINKGAIIKNVGVGLDKPVVMIWNTMSVKVSDSQAATTTGGSHWQTCVIIPKNYKTPTGKQIGNANPKVFFIDSLNEGAELPGSFKYLLTKGHTHTFGSDDKRDYTHMIPAAFPQAEFIERKPKQQEGGSDCGWWAVYNAMMIVLTGNIEFLDKFTQRSREPAYFLRNIFQGMEQDASLGGQVLTQKHTKENISPEEYKAMQQAILESLKSFKGEKGGNTALTSPTHSTLTKPYFAKSDSSSSLPSSSKGSPHAGHPRSFSVMAAGHDPNDSDDVVKSSALKKARTEQTASISPSSSTSSSRSSSSSSQAVSSQYSSPGSSSSSSSAPLQQPAPPAPSSSSSTVVVSGFSSSDSATVSAISASSSPLISSISNSPSASQSKASLPKKPPTTHQRR